MTESFYLGNCNDIESGQWCLTKQVFFPSNPHTSSYKIKANFMLQESYADVPPDRLLMHTKLARVYTLLKFLYTSQRASNHSSCHQFFYIVGKIIWLDAIIMKTPTVIIMKTPCVFIVSSWWRRLLQINDTKRLHNEDTYCFHFDDSRCLHYKDTLCLIDFFHCIWLYLMMMSLLWRHPVSSLWRCLMSSWKH